ALLVDRDFTPGVRAAGGLPGVLRPGLVPELAGARDGVEGPERLAGDHVEGAQIAGRRAVALAGRGAQDDRILPDVPGRAGLHAADRLRIAAQAFAQVHAAVVAERVNGDAGLDVDLLQVAVGGEDQALIGAVLRLPVIESAISDVAFDGVRPALFAGGGV